MVEKITIRVGVENNASKDLSNVAKDVTTFQRTIDGATKSADGFDRVIQKFSVQTFAQGMLNLSTSAAQVYTSFSNLDRAANQVQASLVALHKAEDQIERKQTQLSQSIDKYGVSSERAIMILGELETAEEQLLVKTERHKLAVDQLNDTYILMASNLVNTAFGGFQTLTSLINMSINRTTASTIANAVNTGSIVTNTGAKAVNSATENVSNITKGASVAATLSAATATGVHTASTVLSTTAIRLQTLASSFNPFLLPAVIAAAAIGIGLYIVQQNEFTKATNNMTGSINNSTTSINSLTGAYDLNIPSSDSFGASMSSNSLQASEYSLKLDELNKKIIENNKIISSQSKGEKRMSFQVSQLGITQSNTMSNEELNQFKKQIELDEKKKMLILMQIGDESRKKWATDNMNTGKISLANMVSGGMITVDELQQRKSLIGEAIREISVLVEAGGLSERRAIELTTFKYREKSEAIFMNTKTLEESIRNSLRLNKVESDGAKESIKNLKELAEIKKKLISDYGFTKRGEIGDGFIKGETNYFMGKSGIPFSGIINKKTKQLEKAASYRLTFDTIVNAQDFAAKQLNDGKWDILKVSRYLASVTAKLNSQRNMVGYITSIDAQVAINNQQRIMSRFNKLVNVGGGIGAIGLNASGITGTQALQGYSSLGDIMTKRMTQSGLISAQGRGSTSFPSGRAAFGNKKSRGGSRSRRSLPDSVVRENSLLQLAGIGSTTISNLSKLSGIDIMAGIGDPSALFKWVLPSNNQYVTPAMGRARSDLIAQVESTLKSRIAMANSIISSGRSFVGQGISDMEARYGFDVVVDQEVFSRVESSVGYGSSVNVEAQVRATLASDEKYYNVDDRLRFTDRLAAISTGATVF